MTSLYLKYAALKLSFLATLHQLIDILERFVFNVRLSQNKNLKRDSSTFKGQHLSLATESGFCCDNVLVLRFVLCRTVFYINVDDNMNDNLNV